MADLTELLEAIANVQREIAAPDGERAAIVHDEPPGAVSVFPAFINLEDAIDRIERPNKGIRHEHHLINMHLVFGTADQKYAARTRRKWVAQVLNGFDDNVTLLGIASPAAIAGVNYEPLSLGDNEYACATFVLAARLAVTYEASA